jgi:erythronate-4-phosphate dehydrogenase
MKLVFDKDIPFLAEAVRTGWPEVELVAMEGDAITQKAVKDADVLVVRTRTKIDKALLGGSKVRLVCSATIGFDHIDTAWCDKAGIRWTACPGCNAQAVCDYVQEVLEEYRLANFRCLLPVTIGIVGVGHVGSKVAEMAEKRGMNVLLCDPPKGIGVSLDTIARQSDIITFHTPLTRKGKYATYYMCDSSFLVKTKPTVLIINAARGGVVDEAAVRIAERTCVIDTWEDEPAIDTKNLEHAWRASMHIAGYSLEGKRNATQMCLDYIADTFGLSHLLVPMAPAHGDTASGWLERITRSLKSNPDQFEQLRKTYPLR